MAVLATRRAVGFGGLVEVGRTMQIWEVSEGSQQGCSLLGGPDTRAGVGVLLGLSRGRGQSLRTPDSLPNSL